MSAVMILVLVLLPIAAPAGGDSWKKAGEKDGVTLYQRDHEGRFVDDFKGVVMLDVPVENIGAALLDVDAYTHWFDRCTKMEVVRTNDPYDLILYLTMSSPWPARDRDAVIRATCDVDLETDFAHVHIRKDSDLYEPADGSTVRIPHTDQHWYLETVAPGRVRLTYINDTDPGGDIMGFLVNLVTRMVTHNSLVNLRELVKDPRYAEAGKALRADLVRRERENKALETRQAQGTGKGSDVLAGDRPQ
ncbi:MAG: START domain-containing protein [Desulfatibacillaceae bacterium]